MASAWVHLHPHPGVLQRQLRSPTGGVARDMYRRGKRVEAAAKRLVGVDTGRLRADIGTRPVVVGGVPGVEVGTDVQYARVHHDGRGWVYPVRARVLAFRPKGSSRVIFRPRARPARGTYYLTRAMPAAGRAGAGRAGPSVRG
jgi:hypothetical protein